jgi:hypothetical protein
MEERRRDFIATIFAKRDLDDICEGEAIEQRADRISNVEHQHSQAAVNFIWTRAARVGCLANAADRRQRSINKTNNGAKFYSPHWPRQRVAAKLSPSAFHVSNGLELRKDLLKEFDR